MSQDDAAVEDGELTPTERLVHKSIEIARLSAAAAAIGLGLGKQYRLFAGLFVIVMDFTLALQIFFLSKLSIKVFKWPGGPYQRQSGCQFLANGTVMIILLAIGATDAALAAVALASTTYFLFGGVNHIGTEIHKARRDGRPSVRLHYFRMLGAAAMAGVNYYIIFGLWKALL